MHEALADRLASNALASLGENNTMKSSKIGLVTIAIVCTVGVMASTFVGTDANIVHAAQSTPSCGPVCNAETLEAPLLTPAAASLAQSSPSRSNPLGWFFDTTGFPARWHCGTWPVVLGWLHIASDLAIWGAYMAIPLLLWFFIHRGKTPLPYITWLFIAFIGSCGIGHMMEAIIFWQPIYRIAGVWKAVTATASWATVFALVPIMPKLLKLPNLKDVNERLVAEIAIRKVAEEQVRQIISAAPVGMVMANQSGMILMANRELARMFGYQGGELVGKSLEILVPQKFRGSHPGHRASYHAAPEARRMGDGRELYGLRKDGTEVPVDIGLVPLKTSQGSCVLATIIDITHRRQAEEELRSLNARLEDKNAELEQFVYTASHDLKSPLVTILGYTSHLMDDIQRGETGEIGEYGERITQAAQRMRMHVDDLLELSRVGRASTIPEHVEFSPFVARLWESLIPQDNVSKPPLRTRFEVPAVRMDLTQLTQIIQNLLENAMKYSTPGPGQPEREIEIGTHHAPETEERGSRRLRIYVRDHGPGVPPEHRERVFKLFERLSHDKAGTGVGLAIVRRVAEVLGGRTWVEETPGGGATFWVELNEARMNTIETTTTEEVFHAKS